MTYASAFPGVARVAPRLSNGQRYRDSAARRDAPLADRPALAFLEMEGETEGGEAARRRLRFPGARGYAGSVFRDPGRNALAAPKAGAPARRVRLDASAPRGQRARPRQEDRREEAGVGRREFALAAEPRERVEPDAPESPSSEDLWAAPEAPLAARRIAGAALPVRLGHAAQASEETQFERRELEGPASRSPAQRSRQRASAARGWHELQARAARPAGRREA